MPRKLVASIAVAGVLLAASGAAAQTPKGPPALAAPPVVPNKVYVVEQVVTAKLPEALMQQLGPLKTLRQVEELLKANGIAYGWRKVDLNTATVPPPVLRQIEALPPGEVFVIPAGENVSMNVIVGQKRSP